MTPKEILDKMLDLIKELSDNVRQEYGDKCSSINEIELAIYEARKNLDKGDLK